MKTVNRNVFQSLIQLLLVSEKKRKKNRPKDIYKNCSRTELFNSSRREMPLWLQNWEHKSTAGDFNNHISNALLILTPTLTFPTSSHSPILPLLTLPRTLLASLFSPPNRIPHISFHSSLSYSLPLPLFPPLTLPLLLPLPILFHFLSIPYIYILWLLPLLLRSHPSTLIYISTLFFHCLSINT